MRARNRDVIVFRCFLFCFFGGLGCLIAILPLHMKDVGLTISEAHTVSIVAPLVAALGPLLVGPLAQRLAGTKGYSPQTLLSVFVLLSAACYPLLMCVPTGKRPVEQGPQVRFVCGTGGAVVLQECCKERSCYNWPDKNVGILKLNDCHYDCESTDMSFEGEPHTSTEHDYFDEVPPEATLKPNSEEYGGSGDVDLNEQDNGDTDDSENEKKRRRRHIIPYADEIPPHLCYTDRENSTKCHVYTSSSKDITINASFIPSVNNNCENGCEYRLADFFCRIPPSLLKSLGHTSCRVVCRLPDPYSFKDSALQQTQCQNSAANEYVTFWSYLLVRSIADIFPTTALGLLGAVLVLATQETNLKQGDVGRELAFGSLGYAVLSPIAGLFCNIYLPGTPHYLLAFLAFMVLMILAAVFLIFSHPIQLSQYEWFWTHSAVMPLSSLKKHLGELIYFVCVLILLGSLWSGTHSYLSWNLERERNSALYLGLISMAGALVAVPLLWYSNRVIEYCGHSNIFIIAFTLYIVRYTAFSYMELAWWVLASEALEVFAMSLLWVTVISYMRQLAPHQYTVTAQSMAVLFHFCLGRCLGAVFCAVIITYSGTERPLLHMFHVGAVISAVIASLYFIIYHCILRSCCETAKGKNTPTQHEEVQGSRMNGMYTPLRVYRNEKEGQKESKK